MRGILKSIMPTKHERDMKALWPIVNTINEAYNKIEKLSNDELRTKTLEFRKLISDTIESEERELNELKTRIDEELDMSIDQKEKIFHQIDDLEKIIYQKTQKVLNDILPEAFAVVKETTKRFKDNPEIVVTATDFDRELATKKNYVKIEGDKAIWQNHWIAGGTEITWDMVPYDVQLMGGVVLHQGKISEMATGEGKTLVATLPVYLNALPGRGVHIVTVNDYLAKRDQEWMGPIYEFLFLTVDCIDKHEPNSESRKKAYLADITYGTNNEFGFDYLRDNMAFSLDDIVQRGHYYAIVDEVDSILIDDARTPLIISGPTTQVREQEYDELKPYVIKLVNAQRQLVNKLLNDAKNYLQKPNRSNEDEKLGGEALLRAHRGLPKYGPLIKFLSEPGMKSILYKTENNYLAENQKNMPIIDAELYFVIDERNNSVDLTDKGTELLAKDTGDPKFFIIPDIGSELAELENSNIDPKEKQEKKNELLEDFAIKSDRIHTMHQLLRAYTLFDKDVEYVVLDNKVKIVDEQTGRILEGRRYSDGLHEAIEAKENVKVEAATQTYATITLQNYFRMYKKLAGMTGTAETEAAEFWDIYKLDVVVIPTNKPCIRVDAEDLVYRTKREKYNAVINEVVNLVQKGRPVLIGTTSVETSELLSKMLTLRKIKHNVLNAKQHQREAEIVAKAGLSGSVTIATNMAGRGTDIKLGPGVREVGGLAIIGTERHESRRVDRQLRGRAGRQGDPGTSQFFVSLEDDLMRLFGSDRMIKVLDRIGYKEGEVIQHPMITRSIERAQRKVEENNFSIRKRLLEYDDVMNSQRTIIYDMRRNALYGEKLDADIVQMFKKVANDLVEVYQDNNDFASFSMACLQTFGIEVPYDEKRFLSDRASNLSDELFEAAYNTYIDKRHFYAEKTYPLIKEIYENAGKRYENVAVPYSDGKNQFTIIAPLKKSYQTKGLELMKSIEQFVTFSIIDKAWMDHLREMDDLKQSVNAAVYEQKDPLLIYKIEGAQLFDQLLNKIYFEVVRALSIGRIPVAEERLQETDQEKRTTKTRNYKTGRDYNTPAGTSQTAQKHQEYNDPSEVAVANEPFKSQKVGRNDPCPCGSGKKYKQCHGRTN